jgi:pyridoxal phosphate enzyme (YggS family)
MMIEERLRSVRERIASAAARAGRASDDILVLAVTKGLPADRVAAAAALGLTAVGENRVQEAGRKRPAADRVIAAAGGARLTWHLIGHLQRNKVNAALATFDRIDAVDSLALASELSRRLAEGPRRLPVLVEINTSGETAKHGIAPDEALDLVPEIAALPGLEVQGLMTMAPLAAPPRPAFRSLRRLRDQLLAGRSSGSTGLPHLSMGMSGDFEEAIEEGATQLRLGTAIFGDRSG